MGNHLFITLMSLKIRKMSLVLSISTSVNQMEAKSMEKKQLTEVDQKYPLVITQSPSQTKTSVWILGTIPFLKCSQLRDPLVSIAKLVESSRITTYDEETYSKKP